MCPAQSQNVSSAYLHRGRYDQGPLKSAEEGRATFDDRFEAGDAKLLDLLGVEDQLFQAAGGVISGRSAVLLSHFQVLGAMGRLRSSL